MIRRCLIALSLALGLGIVTPTHADDHDIYGEKLDRSLYGPQVVESWDAVVERAALKQESNSRNRREGAHGEWQVPSPGASDYPHTGQHYITNRWGDTRMGIGFPELVDVYGAYFAGQSSPEVWTAGVQVIGYREGVEVARTEWFRDLGARPRWFNMSLRGVDRIVVECEPVVKGAGWYALDDLTFAPHTAAPVQAAEITVVDFEDLTYRDKLTGTQYMGLTWERGSGTFESGQRKRILPPPAGAPGEDGTEADMPLRGDPPLRDGTAPALVMDFEGAANDYSGLWAIPPDTMGAIGPFHYIELVNNTYNIISKSTGNLLGQTELSNFWPGAPTGIGDPRILYDQVSQRWVALASDMDTGGNRIWLAVSQNYLPTYPWFKTSFVAGAGTDSGSWADYPTLGIDENGIYISALMIPRDKRTIWALDKEPLIDSPQSLGDITAWRNLRPDAYQPAHTYGTAPGCYIVSRYGASTIQVQRINPPLTSPTKIHLEYLAVPSHDEPPLAPALGSVTPLDTVGPRLMMAVYRDGAIWTSQTIGYNGRAACRWYEIDVTNPDDPELAQYGTVADDQMSYFFPSVMVNADGHVVMGFTGSSPGHYASCYYTGRRASDPDGAMADPVLYKAGVAPYNADLDPYGRNRWGDYSYVTLDPDDESKFWCLQEYTAAEDIWGTWGAVLEFEAGPDYCVGDCNCNGQVDLKDINPFAAGLSNPDLQCDPLNFDINQDGVVDFKDINPFAALLTSAPLPIVCD